MSAEWYFIDSASVYGAIFASANDFSEEKTGIKFSKEHFIGIGSTSACNDKNRFERCQYFEYHLILGVYKMPVIFPQIYCKVCALSKFSILALPLFLLSWDQCQSLPTLPICRLLHMGLPSLPFLPSEQPKIPVIANFWGKVCDTFHFQTIVIKTKEFFMWLSIHFLPNDSIILNDNQFVHFVEERASPSFGASTSLRGVDIFNQWIWQSRAHNTVTRKMSIKYIVFSE